MCHPDAPSTSSPAPDVLEEVRIALSTGEELPGLYAHPDHDGPGVLIVADIYGRGPFYEDLAARLAVAGFHTLLPDYFFRQGQLADQSRQAAFARRRQLDDHRALADHLSAIDWLRRQPGVTGGRIGTIGFCMGGTFVLNLAAERADLATVCYYGFPQAPRLSPNPAPPPLGQLGAINGPIIGFWGDQDEGVGMDNVAKLADGLSTRGVDFEHVVYPGLGHGFLKQALPDPGGAGHGDAADSWRRTLAFYRRHLGGSVA
ncbi:MAG TPA: dienelactone hydrolase family protein [Actinomycetes bacterium]|jgi:carboxymethylenebutenolidase|nr:dienelactone hydrolase family protein [Actinomycetes bacterium]